MCGDVRVHFNHGCNQLFSMIFLGTDISKNKVNVEYKCRIKYFLTSLHRDRCTLLTDKPENIYFLILLYGENEGKDWAWNQAKA